MNRQHNTELPSIEEANVSVLLPEVHWDLRVYDITGGREHTLEDLEQQIEGNRAAARRLLGLEGASVFDELSIEEIEEVNPMAAAAQNWARTLQRAKSAIINATADHSRPRPELVKLAFSLSDTANTPRGGEFTPYPHIAPRLPEPIEKDIDKPVQRWSVVLQWSDGATVFVRQIDDPAPQQISIGVGGEDDLDEVRLTVVDDEGFWEKAETTARGAIRAVLNGDNPAAISMSDHLEIATLVEHVDPPRMNTQPGSEHQAQMDTADQPQRHGPALGLS